MDLLFDGNRFYMGSDPGSPLAEITFTRDGKRHLIIEHTVTDPSLRGQGIGRKLVERVAEYARENGFKLLSHCSYARHVLSEPAFDDVYAGQKD